VENGAAQLPRIQSIKCKRINIGNFILVFS